MPVLVGLNARAGAEEREDLHVRGGPVDLVHAQGRVPRTYACCARAPSRTPTPCAAARCAGRSTSPAAHSRSRLPSPPVSVVKWSGPGRVHIGFGSFPLSRRGRGWRVEHGLGLRGTLKSPGQRGHPRDRHLGSLGVGCGPGGRARPARPRRCRQTSAGRCPAAAVARRHRGPTGRGAPAVRDWSRNR